MPTYCAPWPGKRKPTRPGDAGPVSRYACGCGCPVTAPATPSRIYAGPAVGGTWVEKAATADSVFTNADATNDNVVITVRAEQLSDGYDRVQCTAATGTCVAVLHDLTVQRGPANLQSSLVV